jgi:hypothetical protein
MEQKKRKVKDEGFIDLARRVKKMKTSGFMKHTIKNNGKGGVK